MKTNVLLQAAAVVAMTLSGSSIALAAPATVTSGATTTKPAAALVGKSKFVIGGTIVSASATTVSVMVTSTSKNMAALKQTTQAIPIATTTKVTQQGKKLDPSKLAAGAKVKVFGVYDKKASKFVSIRWIKAQ